MISYVPYFIAGVYYGINYERDNIKNIIPIILAFFIIFDSNNGFTVLCKCFIPVLLIQFFPNFTNNTERILSNMANVSFLIYAIHIYVLGRLQIFLRVHVLMKICPYVSFSNIVGRFILLMIVLIITSVIYRFLSKICPYILKVLTGGRCKPIGYNNAI